ncbi:NAD(P)/FAD-dependent oxidoreductase [Saccharopolyspora sp. HNM0983]|uniref:NAD(P)/FAD-dependent oxidoreductase n=1 Tax=Saccharopolyspora montiporae TaxID=2781240 RepID=A0A929FYA4_9PSEU|nr:FAD-dependent oxidoreductase [Saccharopolyspora sp. HNM0983]MBE9375561.1 NAD(P)/FAD-dependent oxidoreductase [Saccharopolyspora sp. HNM0983]
MTNPITCDVAVVGGGAAGLAAAVTLGRSLRSVVVVDSGEPRNAPAAGVHNLLAREGIAPQDLLTAGRREAEQVGAELRRDRAVAARRAGDRIEVDLAGGGTLLARRLLLATGLADELPDIPGVREHWGSDVLHCPYCHGWEVRGRRIGVLGTGPMSAHQALLFRQLSEHVVLFAHRMPDPGEEVREQLDALDVPIIDGTVRRLRAADGALRAVVLDEQEVAVDAVAVAPRFVGRTDLYEQLGGSRVEHPTGEFVETGALGRTEIAGVSVAGNAADLSAMVGAAAASGNTAAAGINADLVAEDARAAVHARRNR